MKTQPTTSAAQNRESSQRREQATSDRRRSGVPPNHGVPQVPPNLIITTLPPDPLKMIFKALPSSNYFVAPVCRRFRDLYEDATKEKEINGTYTYSIASEAALQEYLKEQVSSYSTDKFSDRKKMTSMVGAGCGRTDWVERGGVFDKNTCRTAAKCGQLRVLKWLRGRDCPWDSGTCSGAAMGGHLKILKWARGEGCEWDRGTCWRAARGGHLEVLKWMREEGCEWSDLTCREAAFGGHLGVLKWIINNGCQYDEEYLEEFISDPDFFEWLRAYEAKNGVSGRKFQPQV